jgi:integrase
VIPRNPCDLAAIRKTDNKRDRFLTLEEVARLGEAFDALEAAGANIKAIKIARLWALTGCRRDEIAGLRWSEIDFQRGLLILADGKTGRSVRPLGSAALVLLQSVTRTEGGVRVPGGVWRGTLPSRHPSHPSLNRP